MRVISGGQNGVDLAGLLAAKAVGIETGGTMPKGFRTLDGKKPEYRDLYGMEEHPSWEYPQRTLKNVRDSDATLRLAVDFASPGERCTMRAVRSEAKPFFDVDLRNPCAPQEAVEWLIVQEVKILNVAGNSETSQPGIGKTAEKFLVDVFRMWKERVPL